MRTILSDNEANEILSPFYTTLTEAVEKGIKDYNAYLYFSDTQLSIRHIHEPATKSMIIWNYIINHVKVDFEDKENVRPIIFNRVFGLLIYDSLFIRFKKIDKKGNSFNIETYNSESFNMQSSLKDFPERPTLLKLGWVMNTTYTDIKDLFIVCPRNSKNIHWKINIYEKITTAKYLFSPTDQELSPEIDNLLKISTKLKQKQKQTYGNT